MYGRTNPPENQETGGILFREYCSSGNKDTFRNSSFLIKKSNKLRVGIGIGNFPTINSQELQIGEWRAGAFGVGNEINPK